MFGVAHADDATSARTLFKKGIEEYKAKKYGDASITLLKSYELDPKADTLFALAQAERFDNRCNDALEHYKKLLEQTTDTTTAKAVQSNMDLCPTVDKPKPEEKVTCVAGKPVIVKEKGDTKTIIHYERKSNKLATGLFAAGGLGIGGSVALFLLSRGSLADSDNATTLDESNRLYDQSKDQKRLSFIVGGLGIGLVAGGVVRLMTGKRSTRTEVTVLPSRTGGGGVLVMSRW